MDKQIIIDNAKAIVNVLIRNTPEYQRAYNKIERSVVKFCDKWDGWSEKKQREFYDDDCVWENIEMMVGCLPTLFSHAMGLDGNESYENMSHKDIAWGAACEDVCEAHGTIYRPAADNPLICFMGNELCGDGSSIEDALEYYDEFLDKFIEIYDLERLFDSGELFFVGDELFGGGHSMDNLKTIKKSIKKLGGSVRILEKVGDKIIPQTRVEGGEVTKKVISMSEIGYNIKSIGPSSASAHSILFEMDGNFNSNVNADIVEVFIQKFGLAA